MHSLGVTISSTLTLSRLQAVWRQNTLQSAQHLHRLQSKKQHHMQYGHGTQQVQVFTKRSSVSAWRATCTQKPSRLHSTLRHQRCRHVSHISSISHFSVICYTKQHRAASLKPVWQGHSVVFGITISPHSTTSRPAVAHIVILSLINF